MIAVLAHEAERPVVEEFFELFKTPWEFYRSDHEYEVLICSSVPVPKNAATKLLLIFGSEAMPFDRENEVQTSCSRSNRVLSFRTGRIPIYGKCLTFDGATTPWLTDENSTEVVAMEITLHGQMVVRVGYDLFCEIRHLLTHGQPLVHAGTPALEMHIALLRDLITACSIPLVELPPVPAGYSFIACLTHDVDHVGVRNHKCDHTMFGFLYRATVGSLLHFLAGKKSARQLAVNWRAALSLPFVYLGLAKDFWYQFEGYLKIEKGLTSTFFLIPRKDDPGEDANGHRSAKRAARYDVVKLADHLQQLQSHGHEIGLHGINAWRDSVMGRAELERMAGLTGKSQLGVRMHWLFFDEQSPAALEKAGFSYDSSVGYNATVGYRAGTTQVYKPVGAARLLELPMHIMDTALFYPSHMNLSAKEAEVVVGALRQNAARFGGALTINWHDRSIAPERLWGDFYVDLLDNLKREGAWISNAAQTVSWFRQRRAATIERVTRDNGTLKIKASAPPNDGLPGLRIRVYKANGCASGAAAVRLPGEFIDVAFNGDSEVSIAV